MESYEEVYKSLCRICLEHSKYETMVNLLEPTSEDGLSCYGKAVKTFANISFKSDFNLPSMMCKNCLYLLKQAIHFKFKCEWTQKCLETVIKNITVSKVSMRNLMEKVVDYTLYMRYFPEIHVKESSLKSTTSYSQGKSRNFVQKTQKGKQFPLEDFLDLSSDSNQDYSRDIVSNDVLENNKSNIENADDILNKLESILQTDSKILNEEYDFIVKKRQLKHKYKQNSIQKKYKISEVKRRPEERDLICKICKKVLANQSTYEYHMQRHNGCRYICEHCAKGFPVRSELQIHLVVRHGIGPYLECSHCTFKAPRKFDLIEHERLHTGERPYTCDKCGLTFRRRGIWKKHLTHHNEKSIQCPLCPRKFYQRSDLLAHKNNVHERLYVYLCNKCGTTYAKTDTVRKHLMERHGIPKELQGKITRINKGTGTGFPES